MSLPSADRPAPDEIALHFAAEMLIAAAEGDGTWHGNIGMDFDEDWSGIELLDDLVFIGSRLAQFLAMSPWGFDEPRAQIEKIAELLSLDRALEPARTSTRPQEEPVIRKNPLDSARAVIDKQEAKLAEWEATRTTKAAELTDLEQRIGTELVDAEDPDAAMASVHEATSRLRSDIDGADRAIEVALGKLDDARRDCLRSAAEHCHRLAADKRAEAAKRLETTNRLLDELEKHEGLRFQPMVQWLNTLSGTSSWGPGTTATARLTQEADELEQLAAEGEGIASAASELDPARWVNAMAKLDPDGPEATAKAERLAGDVAQAEQHRAAEDAALEGRREWIAARTDELLTQPGPWGPVQTAEGKRTVAERQAKQEHRERGQVPAS